MDNHKAPTHEEIELLEVIKNSFKEIALNEEEMFEELAKETERSLRTKELHSALSVA